MGQHCERLSNVRRVGQTGQKRNKKKNIRAEFKFELILAYKLQIIWLSGFITFQNKILLGWRWRWTSWMLKVGHIILQNTFLSSPEPGQHGAGDLQEEEDWLGAGLANWPAHSCEPGHAWPVSSTLSGFVRWGRVTTSLPPPPPPPVQHHSPPAQTRTNYFLLCSSASRQLQRLLHQRYRFFDRALVWALIPRLERHCDSWTWWCIPQ